MTLGLRQVEQERDGWNVECKRMELERDAWKMAYEEQQMKVQKFENFQKAVEIQVNSSHEQV